MSRSFGSSYFEVNRFPRVSGDEPDDWRELAAETEFSPRERG